MDVEQKWMLMTYYCPTHGDSGIVRPIEMKKNEIRQKFLKKGKTLKMFYQKFTQILDKGFNSYKGK